MRLLNSSILFLVISITLPSEAYRILGVFPLNAKSHFAMFGRLMKELAKRGHQVDVVSHFPLEKSLPNYNDVVNLNGTLPSLINNMTVEMVESYENHGSSAKRIAILYGREICHLLDHPQLKNLIQNPPKNPAYDLVIAELFGASCYLALGQHFKVPVVAMISTLMLPWANDQVANPDNTAYIPNVFTNFNGRMSFWQRVQNTLTNFKSKWVFHQASEEQTKLIKKYIGPHAPSVREAEKNVSLILVNSHYSLHGTRPFTPAVVEVGGLHIDERDVTLTNDLQKWLDDSAHGFIYISFGSILKIESLPEETLVAIYTSLAKLAPARVLIRVGEPEELPFGLPSNVLTYRWIPQIAVLKHKNIRAFMTHGGLMGTQEAIHFGVPMIGVPFFGDQHQNMRLYSQKNLAVTLSHKKLTVEKLDAAFHAVLHDPSYIDTAKRMSALFRDRHMSPLDTAVYWVEYVIRYNGTNLRSLAMELEWWQIALFDVYGFLILSIILVGYLLLVVVKTLIGVFFSTSVKRFTESRKVKLR